MQPISNDKRELIISAKERGEKVEVIALWMDVAVSSIYNVCRLQRQSGAIAPKPFTGRRSILTSEQLSTIKELVEQESDITLEEIIARLALPIKKSRLSVVLIGMGFSFKKRLSTQKSNNERMFKKSE